MSLSVAIIDALLATGATREQIAAAMKADISDREAQETARLEAKRDGNRSRQQRKRERDNAKSRRVTPVTRDACDPSPNDIYSNPQPDLPTKPIGLEPAPKKHRLPETWEPMPFKAGSQAALAVLRWEPGRLERELAKFRDHHTAVGTKWENWQAAWSKWVNGSSDFERVQRVGQHHSNIGKTTEAVASFGGWNNDLPM